MDPKDFYTLAEKLSQTDDPAHCRSAISRAYYAVYNHAVNILRDWGFEVENRPSGHKEVQYRLFYSNDTDFQHISTQLGDLLGDRVKADYRLDQPGIESQRTAKSKVSLVKRIMEDLSAGAKDAHRSGRMYENIKNNEPRIQAQLKSHKQTIAGD